MKRITLLFVVAVICVGSIFAQNELYTSRQNNYVREGAGAYFDLVDIVPSGKKLILIEKK